jgi:hypothetical protein
LPDDVLVASVASSVVAQPATADMVNNVANRPALNRAARRPAYVLLDSVIITARLSSSDPDPIIPGASSHFRQTLEMPQMPLSADRRTLEGNDLRYPTYGGPVMGDNALAIVVGILALIFLIGVVLLGVSLFVVYRYRVPLRGIAAMAGALVYLVSPVDVVPEAALGPFGLIDDMGVVGAVAMFVFRLVQARRNAGLEVDGGPGPASRPESGPRPGSRPKQR